MKAFAIACIICGATALVVPTTRRTIRKGNRVARVEQKRDTITLAMTPDGQLPSVTTAYEFAGSYASLYATLGLYIISFPGLYSLIKRSVKVQLVQKTFIFEEGDMKSIATEVMGYMKANNYDVEEAGETITFKGLTESSKSQAFFLSFCTFIGLASLALVLQVQFPAIGSYWFLMTLISPYAGIYYWQNAQNDNEFKVKLEERDDQAKALLVRGGKEDVERMARVMDLREEGMVRVKGIFEDALT
uniref:Calcium uniporter protein n=1 Tax=Aureoumbra lagunensis TaxID=44058 RepID=A0A7S3NJ09_9STRA|mmetsp:Transcript_1905/g.2891  ORF Transcript_1905/g.2891 Transcript_1905/m.2891 type:complete len:246 (+) Transcript_1905:50-787(+)